MSDNEQNKTNHERINSEVLLNHNYINILTHVEIKTKKKQLVQKQEIIHESVFMSCSMSH